MTKSLVREDIESADIGQTIRRYESLDADGRAEFDDLVQREGPDAITVSGKVDDETFDAIMRADISTDRKASMLDSISEVDDMSRFDRLRDAVGQKAFRLARTLPGDGGKLETLLRRTDLTTQRILADGSTDLDAEFNRAVVRGLDDSDVDSEQIEEAVRSVSWLENTWADDTDRVAKRLLIDEPDSGSQLLRSLDNGELHRLFENVDSTPTLSRLSRQFDDGVVERQQLSEISELLDSGDMDGADLRRFTEIIEADGNGPDFGSDLTTDDVLTVANRGELSDTRLAVTDGEGNLRWMEFNEGESVGYDKILTKHENQFYDQYGSIGSRQEIKQVIGDAIEQSDTDSVIVKPNPGGGKRYYLHVEDGSNPLRVSTSENGFILSAFPDENAKGIFN